MSLQTHIKLSFVGAIATPPKFDLAAPLQAKVEQLEKENMELQKRLVDIAASLMAVENKETEHMEAMLMKAKQVETETVRDVKNQVKEVATTLSNKNPEGIALLLNVEG